MAHLFKYDGLDFNRISLREQYGEREILAPEEAAQKLECAVKDLDSYFNKAYTIVKSGVVFNHDGSFYFYPNLS